MKVRLFIMIAFFVTLTGLAFTYVQTKGDKIPEMASATTEPARKTATELRAQQASDRPIRADAYVEYGYRVIDMTPGTKLLFFHAPWCPQCRALDKDILSADIPDDVTVIRVDYDKNQELRQKYGVTIQTTLVKLDDDGDYVDKYIAYDQPTFEAVRQHLLR